MNSNFFMSQIHALKTSIHSIWSIEGFTSFWEKCIIPKDVIEIILNFSDSKETPAQLTISGDEQ